MLVANALLRVSAKAPATTNQARLSNWLSIQADSSRLGSTTWKWFRPAILRARGEVRMPASLRHLLCSDAWASRSRFAFLGRMLQLGRVIRKLGRMLQLQTSFA